MFKTIIFDIGGVIIDFSEDAYVAYLAKRLKFSKRYIASELLPLIVEMEYGHITLAQAENEFSKGMVLPKSKLYFVEAYRELARPDRKVIAIMKRLSANYRIGVLSNISMARYREARSFAIDSLVGSGVVKDVVASCFVGLRKPDVRIYEMALKKMNAKASETIFIDNQYENVVGADRAGIKGVFFTGAKKLERDMKRVGVL